MSFTCRIASIILLAVCAFGVKWLQANDIDGATIYYSGYFEDLTVDSPLEFQPGGGSNPNSIVRLNGDWTNNSVVRINSHGGKCLVSEALSLSGNGVLEFPLGGNNSYILQSAGGGELINDTGHTIRSYDHVYASGLVDGEIYDFPAIGGPDLHFHNKGLIECAIAVGETEGGRLQIKVRQNSRNEGFIRNQGGFLSVGAIDGYLINTGGVIENLAGHIFAAHIAGGVILNDDSMPVVLFDVLGCQLVSNNGGSFIAFGGLLDSLQVNAPLELGIQWNNLTLRGNWNNQSQITITGPMNEFQYAIIFGEVSFNGKGSLILTSEYPLISAVSPDGDSLTNGLGHTLGGTSQIGNGPMRIYNEGIFAPGAPVGVMPVVGWLTFSGTSELRIDLGGTAAGLDYDVLRYQAGPLSLDGALKVNFVDGFENTVSSSDAFTIITPYDGSTYTGFFSNLLVGNRVMVDGSVGSFLVTYDGSTVVLSDYQAAPPSPTAEQSWAWQNFGDLDPATESTVWGLDANPDNDGYSNLLEYALVLNPTAPTQSINPTEIAPSPSGFRLRLRQRKASSDPSLTYSVQASPTMLPGSWSSNGVSEAPPRESIDNETEWVTYQLPDTDPDPQFVRVVVSQAAP